MYCTSCGAQVDDSAQFCSQCGRRVGLSEERVPAPGQPQVILVRAGKSAGLAAVLSFFWAGLGQIYNGQIAKGIVFMFLQVINVLLMFVLVGFLTWPVIWIWGIVDAYGTAERLNRDAGLA